MCCDFIPKLMNYFTVPLICDGKEKKEKDKMRVRSSRFDETHVGMLACCHAVMLSCCHNVTAIADN